MAATLLIFGTIDGFEPALSMWEYVAIAFNLAIVAGVSLWRHPGKLAFSLLISVFSFTIVIALIGIFMIGIPLILDRIQ